ncbi:MAG: sigma factor [Bradyrhizobium sp.]|nr:sigma factor [Bradyrhizobium sp.]
MIDTEDLRTLMLQAREGDGRAMRRLLRDLSPMLRSYIRRQLTRCGQTDPADTEDLLRVTLLAIYTKQHTYDPAQPLAGWLYAIAHYKVVDHLRAIQRRRADVPIEEAEAFPAVADFEAAEARLDITTLDVGTEHAMCPGCHSSIGWLPPLVSVKLRGVKTCFHHVKTAERSEAPFELNC